MQGIEVKHAKSLSFFFLKLAQETLRRCRRRTRQASSLDVLQVHILVAVSLEAFINEICLEAIESRKDTGQDATQLEEAIYGNDGRGCSVRRKWQVIPEYLYGWSFDETNPLRDDFETLIELRNALMHYKSEYSEAGYVPVFLRNKLSSLNLLPPRTQSEDPHWIEMISDLTMGRWAFNTGVRMIEEFLQVSDGKTKSIYTWLLEGLRIHAFGEDWAS